MTLPAEVAFIRTGQSRGPVRIVVADPDAGARLPLAENLHVHVSAHNAKAAAAAPVWAGGETAGGRDGLRSAGRRGDPDTA